MAIKRTSGISPIVSSLDRRIKAVESGQTTLSAQYANAVTVSVSDDDNPDIFDPNVTSGVDKKYEYKRVLKAYIYGSKVTGYGSRCELYFGENPQLEADDPLDVQGVHGTSTDNFNISPKQFKTLAVDSSPWDDDVRSTQSWRDTPTTGNNGDTITNTVWFNPVVEVPSSYPRTSGRELITTRRIDTVDIDGTTVTVNLNSTHKFELGDIISVDLPEPAFGIDGLFRISAVPDTSTIVYELDSPVGSPITLDSSDFTGGEAYVYPVARRYVKDGEVWLDKSVTPNRVWVWNVMRWYDTAEPIGDVSAVKDGIAPSPVTNLEGESQVPSGATTPVIDLTWTPPTTRSDGTPIANYLSGYIIRYKRSNAPTWETIVVPDDGGDISSYRITTGLEQNFTYNIEVYVTDIMSQKSTAATIDVVTGTYSETLNPPAAPTVSSKLGTITVDWSGLDANGNLPVKGVLFVEIHESTTSGFTPSEATLVQTIPISNGGNYAVLTGRLFDNTTFYYYKVVFVREINSTEIVKSDPSAESIGIKVQGVTGPDIVANSITTNNIEAGFVSAELFRGGSIIAQTVGSTRRVEIKASGITAYPISSPSNPTFELESNTGNVKIVGGSIKTVADANRGVEISSTGIVAKNSSNTNTFVVESSTGNVIISGGSLTSPTINGGTITGGTIQTSDVANTGIKITTSNLIAYNSSGSPTFTVNAGSGNVTLSGGTLTGSVIRSNAPVTGNAARVEMSSDGFFCFDADGNAPFRAYANGVVFMSQGYAGNLSADQITSGELVGRTIRTVPAGSLAKRIILNTAGEIVFFNLNSSTESGKVEATDNGLSMTTRGSTQISFDPNGSQTAFVSTSGMGFSGIDKRWIGSLIATGGLQAGNGNVVLSSNGNISAASISGSSLSSSGGLTVTSGGAAIVGGITATSLIDTDANVRAGNRFRQGTFTTLTGTTTAVHRLNSDGFFTPAGSDARLKENVVELEDGLGLINNLRPVKYTYISEAESPIINYGLIAQEVRPFVEENSNIVNGQETDEEYLSLEYIQFIAPLIAAVKELSAKNDALEARLAALEGNG